MRTAITAAIFALVASFATPAAAAMPCNGSSGTCTWTCDQDGDGNISQYHVSCGVSDYCVNGITNEFIIGTCDEMVGDPVDPIDQIIAFEKKLVELLKSVGGTCDDYVGKK